MTQHIKFKTTNKIRVPAPAPTPSQAQKPAAVKEEDKYKFTPKQPAAAVPAGATAAGERIADPVPYQHIPPPPQAQPAQVPGIPVIKGVVPERPKKAPVPGRIVSSTPAAPLVPPPMATPVLEDSKSATVFSERTALEGGKGAGKMNDITENCKEQLQIYLEVCDSIANETWHTPDIIDIMHVMIEALNFDVVALSVINIKDGKRLCPPSCRGFKFPPDANVVSLWESAIVDGPTMSWNKLMGIAAGNQNDLSKWIHKEGLDSIGYVPIHDNKSIYGLIFVATHGKKVLSPLASPILELCGGRLGLMISLRRYRDTWQAPNSTPYVF